MWTAPQEEQCIFTSLTGAAEAEKNWWERVEKRKTASAFPVGPIKELITPNSIPHLLPGAPPDPKGCLLHRRRDMVLF